MRFKKCCDVCRKCWCLLLETVLIISTDKLMSTITVHQYPSRYCIFHWFTFNSLNNFLKLKCQGCFQQKSFSACIFYRHYGSFNKLNMNEFSSCDETFDWLDRFKQSCTVGWIAAPYLCETARRFRHCLGRCGCSPWTPFCWAFCGASWHPS